MKTSRISCPKYRKRVLTSKESKPRLIFTSGSNQLSYLAIYLSLCTTCSTLTNLAIGDEQYPFFCMVLLISGIERIIGYCRYINKELSKMYHNISIYSSYDNLGKPCFELNVLERNPAKPSELIDAKYKVTLTALSSQEQYDQFRIKVYDAIAECNSNLEFLSPTILFTALKAYKSLVEVQFEQDYALNSKESLRIAQPLAGIFSKAKEAEKENKNISKRTIIELGGIVFEIKDAGFTDWILQIIKQDIVNGNFSLDLGLNMIELKEALKQNSIDDLKSLKERKAITEVIKNKEFITSFCIAIHRLISPIMETQLIDVNIKQLELYRSLLQAFNVPFSNIYIAPQDKSQSQTRKMMNDKFGLLLRRALRHI
jgi:hypothetical protein